MKRVRRALGTETYCQRIVKLKLGNGFGFILAGMSQ